MNRGTFITLEGCEGVGKTTNLAFIERYLHEKYGFSVLVTREPGGTILAEKIRELLLTEHSEKLISTTELLLVFAARAQHIEHIIKPALEQGKWVICDRFTDATYAYQGAGRRLPIENIQWLENFVQDDFRPDLTLVLDAPVNVGIERAKKRGTMDRFEAEEIEFFKRIRMGYLKLAFENENRIKVIQANQPLAAVQKAIAEAISMQFLLL